MLQVKGLLETEQDVLLFLLLGVYISAVLHESCSGPVS